MMIGAIARHILRIIYEEVINNTDGNQSKLVPPRLFV